MIDATELANDIEHEARAILAADETPDIAVLLMVALRDLRADLETLRKDCERELIARMGSKVIQVEGVGQVEVKKSTKRSGWKMDDLVDAVVARVIDDRFVLCDDDGELLPYPEIARRLTSRLRDCVGFSYGKITGLRELGIEADEYCRVDTAAYSVQLPGRQ